MGLTASVQQALALASQLLQKGDIAGAERVLTPLFGGIQPPVPQALDLLGSIRMRHGRAQDACDLFARARQSDPREALYVLHLAQAQAASGGQTEAIAAYRAAIKLKPDLAAAYLELGVLQQRAGQLEEAENTYRKLLREIPGNDQAKLMLAVVLMEAARPAEAEAVLREHAVRSEAVQPGKR
jgi:predicted Zn-dependent protease